MTIEERADAYVGYPEEIDEFTSATIKREAYIRGAKEQKAIDDEFCKSGEASDGYHTFNELYDFRREYNAALVNSGVWKAHKSYRHHDGELCFGGGIGRHEGLKVKSFIEVFTNRWNPVTQVDP